MLCLAVWTSSVAGALPGMLSAPSRETLFNSSLGFYLGHKKFSLWIGKVLSTLSALIDSQVVRKPDGLVTKSSFSLFFPFSFSLYYFHKRALSCVSLWQKPLTHRLSVLCNSYSFHTAPWLRILRRLETDSQCV